MVQSNQNENVMRIEIKYYEIFQNDVFMEEEIIPQTLQRNESLQTQLNIVPKMIKRMWMRYLSFACLEIVLEPYGKNALC